MNLISRRLGYRLLSAAVVAGTSTHLSAATTGYVMNVQMVPAICSLYPETAKKRKCLEGYSLNITGLFPEDNPVNCTMASSAKLPPLQAKVVARVMPDDHARTLLWQTIGGCMPMNASQYFRTIINYADRLKVPHELTDQESIVMSVDTLRTKFLKINPQLPAQGIRFNCQNMANTSLLVGVKVCYRNGGQYKQCPAHIVNSCPSTVTIKGSY